MYEQGAGAEGVSAKDRGGEAPGDVALRRLGRRLQRGRAAASRNRKRDEAADETALHPHAEDNRAVEVLTMGRIGVDLYPEQIGVSLADVRTFRKMLGGSATNVAVAAARYGHRAGVITKVGDDPFGPYVRQALGEFGVDASRVGTHPTLRTPVVFCEIFPPDNFPILFYRQPTAPDMTLDVGELDLDEIAAADLFWTTGTGLSEEPSRTATLAALDARGRRAHTVHDLDYRPVFWSSGEEAGRWGREAVARATVVVGGRTEAVPLVGDLSPSETARALL